MADATTTAPATSNPAATGAGGEAGAPTTTGGVDASLLTGGAEGKTEPTDPSKSGEEGKDEPSSKTEGDETNKGDKPAEVPEKYEFKAPEGVELDSVAAGEFSALAKDLKLTADQAQGVVDIAVKMQQRQAESVAATVKEWGDQSKADKEFGGDNLDANLAIAKKAVDTFGSETFKGLLNQSGLGNHPEFIRFALKAGKAISNDTFVKSGAPSSTNGASLAERMYPNQPK